jgi:oxygen-independent coproporphyrinogen-3 oxidase
MNTRSNAGLYIHIPFCRSLCLYCDFYSKIARDGEIGRFLAAIETEARLRELASPDQFIFDTVFVGGGTPSILKPVQIAALFASLRDKLRIADDAEVTIECNPSTLSEDLLDAYHAIGINRISFGVQSFNDGHLARLGRPHSAREAVTAFEMFRDFNFDNISIDLIYGLPEQTPDEWDEDLKMIVALRPEHVSAYNLIIEKETPFGVLHGKGELKLPSDDAQHRMYETLNERLGKAGYYRYEISNFTRPGYECRHNLKYWHLEPYIGLGPAAVSFDGARRWKNKPDLDGYLASLESGQPPPRESEVIAAETLRREFIMLSLRLTQGLSLDSLINRFSYDLLSDRKPEIETLLSGGYIRLENNGVTLEPKSLFISDEIIVKLI